MKRKTSNPMGEERIYPDDGLACTILGTALLQAGRHEEGITALDRATDLKLDNEFAWANAGIALPKIQRLLGHRSVTTTERYLNVKLEEKRQAVMVLDTIWGKKIGFHQSFGTDMAQESIDQGVTYLLPDGSTGRAADS